MTKSQARARMRTACWWVWLGRWRGCSGRRPKGWRGGNRWRSRRRRRVVVCRSPSETRPSTFFRTRGVDGATPARHASAVGVGKRPRRSPISANSRAARTVPARGRLVKIMRVSLGSQLLTEPIPFSGDTAGYARASVALTGRAQGLFRDTVGWQSVSYPARPGPHQFRPTRCWWGCG
jgi:hypothetical protein